ncbi:MAG: phosphoribosylaminoimidazolesuccinocarboxamide synthase, partial [Bacteroidales bacterium]|nr:phosphoribosylaminoimidazolesuccinocarboxamide synthase [Bacteroidales bacterium]
MGSVKDLVVLKSPTNSDSGIANFIFSDRYSVFDWGEMPDHIKNKGKALCLIGAYFFEKLEDMGIKTHYIGVVENGKIKHLTELNEPVNAMQVKLVQVIKPEIKDGGYDYSVYRERLSNFLIPLEIIYRNSLPEGSSVFKRIKDGDLKIEDVGLDKIPSPGQKLEQSILDVSTKLEVTDRYMTWKEAKQISGLSDKKIEAIKKTTLQINELITNEVGRLGLSHEDGKVEFSFDENRNLMLVDILGTPDECRFTFERIAVSKEAARIFYRNT